ncbi:MAG TPA: hypothetical protein VMG10_04700 [Gemmataceae bacterium]|nr:hypothetical protein [Gemmataceae bacterium]
MSFVRKDASRPILERRQTDADGWEYCERLNKSEAERLLDWLEANGYAQKVVIFGEDGGFTVRWRR